MIWWVFVLLAVGCIKPDEPQPVKPEPIQEPAPEEPTPVRPQEPYLEVATNVRVGDPFVVRLCAVPFEANAQLIFDGKYPAGGLMGWDSATNCKRQTVKINTAGNRLLQFSLDGKLQNRAYKITVAK